MQSRKPPCTNHHSKTMLILHRLCSLARWFTWRRRPSKVKARSHDDEKKLNFSCAFHQTPHRPIRLATFNAALFSLASAVPENPVVLIHEEGDGPIKIPKGILKQSPFLQEKERRSKPRVWINLPENEISLAAMRSPICNSVSLCVNRTIYEVLKEVDADIWALQDVEGDEEKEMRPLSDLARALGMNYVFAESWAPQFGNAVLSKWPIKKWRVQRICDDKDFRNVIKATIDVPWTRELNVYSTQLDHLDEKWRMKQINAMIQSNDEPHILAGGLNSLDASDYSIERWNDIVKYYRDLGKPTPKVEVTSFLKKKEYIDAKDFAGECEPIVMIAKGQNVQGTCKYGTRVDYILGSKGLPYAFVPGSYSVISSKGTSDHHIVKVEILKAEDGVEKSTRVKKLRQRVVRMTSSCSS